MPLDFAKERAFRIGAQTLSKNIRNLPGLSNLLNGNTPKNPAVTLGNYSGKRSTENLSFPLDVEGGPGVGNHGHYIMFYINAQEKAKLQMGGTRATGGAKSGGRNPVRSVMEGNKQNNIPTFINVVNSSTGNVEKKSNKEGHRGQLNDNFRAVEAKRLRGDTSDDYTVQQVKNTKLMNQGQAGIAVRRAPTRRLKTAIALYMPPQVSVTYGSNYTDTEIGGGVALGLSLYDQYSAGKLTLENAISQGEETLKEATIKSILGFGGLLPGFQGVAEAEAMREGRIITNRMELAFKGINKRQFQYSFKMIPRSKAEADEIRKIITAFKFNMLPEFTGGNRAGRQLTIPNTFDIQYMYTGNQNQYLHNISTCVLETMSVTYGGDRYKTFEANSTGAPVVETNLTLNFKEMEIITRERIQEGY